MARLFLSRQSASNVLKLDRIAILLSGICLLHCLAIPLALVVLPALGSMLFDSHDVFHTFLLVIGPYCQMTKARWQVHRGNQPQVPANSGGPPPQEALGGSFVRHRRRAATYRTARSVRSPTGRIQASRKPHIHLKLPRFGIHCPYRVPWLDIIRLSLSASVAVGRDER